MRFTPHQIVTTALRQLRAIRRSLDLPEIGRTEKVIILGPHTLQDGD
jgi:hypothetical protein